MKKEFFGMKAKVCFLLVAVFLMSQCANQSVKQSNLPTDIRGLRLEMTREEAHKVLEEIAMGKKDGPRGAEIWQLKDDPNFSHVAVGFDKSDTVKYITATLEDKWVKLKKPMNFSDVGELSKAKKESVGHINKYMWDVDESDGMPEHQVYTYGEDEEKVLHFSLVKRMEKEEEGEK